MRGFIELTSKINTKMLLNVNQIECVFTEGASTKIATITDSTSILTVKETYDEVKQKMAEAINASSVVRVIE